MADSVVEGTGDHCCEYMTGGNVVVLGTVGRNVGAGMTGGVAYILDEFPEGEFMEHVNLEIVKAQRIATPEGEAIVKGMIEKHVELTGKRLGQLGGEPAEILAACASSRGQHCRHEPERFGSGGGGGGNRSNTRRSGARGLGEETGSLLRFF
ncbi:unnamed protein product [Ectocarpus fasciculatus]